MIFMLDTHMILWAAQDSNRLSMRARSLLTEPTHGFMFSAAVIWEVSVKTQRAKPDFDVDPRLLRRGLLANGYTELAITTEHTLALLDLPDIHRDPFDRIQVAQARVEGLVLLTNDDVLATYGSPVELV